MGRSKKWKNLEEEASRLLSLKLEVHVSQFKGAQGLQKIRRELTHQKSLKRLVEVVERYRRLGLAIPDREESFSTLMEEALLVLSKCEKRCITSKD